MNRLEYANGERQGSFKRVLCVCSGGMLRSATAALVLSRDPYAFNTRAAGTDPMALIRVDAVLIGWAQEIVCMTREHVIAIKKICPHIAAKVFVLNIEDDFRYRENKLIDLIRSRYQECEL